MDDQTQRSKSIAVQALWRSYIIDMQASQARRMSEINRLTETRIAAQANAQSLYDETIRLANAEFQATIGAAEAIYEAALKALGETFNQQTKICKTECKAAEEMANAQYDKAKAAIEELHKLTKCMIQEIYEVELESISDHNSPEYGEATSKYKSALAEAQKKYDCDLEAAGEVRNDLHRVAREKCQVTEKPARIEFDAGYKRIKDAFSPIKDPAQQIHSAAKIQAWDTLQASRKAAEQAEVKAREEMELRFKLERRQRVMHLKQMEETLERFFAVCQ